MFKFGQQIVLIEDTDDFGSKFNHMTLGRVYTSLVCPNKNQFDANPNKWVFVKTDHGRIWPYKNIRFRPAEVIEPPVIPESVFRAGEKL